MVAESVRYYPNGSTAAHVLGYLGQISESEKAEYVDEKAIRLPIWSDRRGIERRLKLL